MEKKIANEHWLCTRHHSNLSHVLSHLILKQPHEISALLTASNLGAYWGRRSLIFQENNVKSAVLFKPKWTDSKAYALRSCITASKKINKP